MTDRQNAKLNMAQRVSDALKRYENVYKGIPPIVEAVNELNKEISNIRETQKERVALNLPAITIEKRIAEKEMIKPCVKIANILYVIGFTSDNNDLITLNGLSESSFYRLSGNATFALAKRILDLSRKYAVELKNYGVEDGEIDKMEKSIEAFRILIAKPMDMIGERKQKTTNLVQFFATLDSILYDKLDHLMVIYKHSSPDFYDEYRTARNYIITTERKKDTE